MAPMTLSLSVQVTSRGEVNVHTWSATYDSRGRQLPQQLVTAHNVDPGDLSYLVSEFADAVELARARVAPEQRDRLPL